jgi:hypothetical protein
MNKERKKEKRTQRIVVGRTLGPGEAGGGYKGHLRRRNVKCPWET